MKYLAHFFSTILHPLLMPSIGVILLSLFSPLKYYGYSVNSSIFMFVFIFTMIIPALSIWMLYSFRVIDDYTLHNRKERTIPYLITALCYLICAVYMYFLSTPKWIMCFFIGGMISLIIDLIITKYWKISAHMTGIGGLLSLIFVLYFFGFGAPEWLFLLAILLTGILGSSRIYLNCHTLGQVLAGTFNGFVSIYLSIYFIPYLLVKILK